MLEKLRGLVFPGGKWPFFLSFILPVVLLTGLAVVFLPQSTGSDSLCGSGGCGSGCGSDNNEEAKFGCGESLSIDKTAALNWFRPCSITSGDTDMRCGYVTTWSYAWHNDKRTTNRPKVTISVKPTKGSAVIINKQDTLGGSKWFGNKMIEKSDEKWVETNTVKITLMAELAFDLSHITDYVDISMKLTYCTVK